MSDGARYRVVCNDTYSDGRPLYTIEQWVEYKRWFRHKAEWRRAWDIGWRDARMWESAKKAQKALTEYLQIEHKKETFVPHVVSEYYPQSQIHDDYQDAIKELDREIPNVI